MFLASCGIDALTRDVGAGTKMRAPHQGLLKAIPVLPARSFDSAPGARYIPDGNSHRADTGAFASALAICFHTSGWRKPVHSRKR